MTIDFVTFEPGMEYYAELERAVRALRKKGKFVFPYQTARLATRKKQ